MNIDWLREHCLSLPHATETVQWGDDLVFKIGGKMFAVVPLEPSAVNHLAFKARRKSSPSLRKFQELFPLPTWRGRCGWHSKI
jgi:predicted DNA-binding protein (MmcQ/YjbR family)